MFLQLNSRLNASVREACIEPREDGCSRLRAVEPGLRMDEKDVAKSVQLMGISPELDEIIHDFAFLANYYGEFHPANAGDVSQVLSDEVGASVLTRFSNSISEWFDLQQLESLGSKRADGRSGYRCEGISDPRFYETIAVMAEKTVLITSTGSQLPAISHTLTRGQSGRLMNIIQVDPTARKIRIVYGNAEHGSIPSIETHVHLLSNALSMCDGCTHPATVHAHPYNLVLLGRHHDIRGDFSKFNVVIHTQIEGLNRNYPDLIGVVPYAESGSAALVSNSYDWLRRHRLVLWMNHGFVVRDSSIRRAYTLMAYAEEAARAAIDSLRLGAEGLPFDRIEGFLARNNLLSAFHGLRDGPLASKQGK